jgi:hypothetical protein
VLVWKIDRYSRSLKHLINALADLSGYGVAFISLRDNIDLSTPSGRLVFQIIGAMAEFERALIQERVKAGLRNVTSAVWLSPPKPPLALDFAPGFCVFAAFSLSTVKSRQTLVSISQTPGLRHCRTQGVKEI